MNTEAVLQRLDNLGVKVEVDGIGVYVDRAERVPADLWPLLSRSKLELFVMVMTERILLECSTRDQLLMRLRTGHDWIAESAAMLSDAPNHGEGTDRLLRTMRWSQVWLLLEQHLRDVYRFEGCVLDGHPCTSRRGLFCTHCKKIKK